jgi:hypothetical protein
MSRWSVADLARRSVSIQGTPLPLKPRRKYSNEPAVVDGILFDSKLEVRRYGELKLLKMAGAITDLKIQQKWYLHVHGVKLGYYESDFSYLEDGKQVIEDCKGVKTPIYRWKKRHVHAEYGIHIREIKA